jgi:hypothetical protein
VKAAFYLVLIFNLIKTIVMKAISIRSIFKSIFNFKADTRTKAPLIWSENDPVVIYDWGYFGVFIEVLGDIYEGAPLAKPDYDGNRRLEYMEQIIVQKQLPVIRFHRSKGVGVDKECLMIGLNIPKTIAKDNFGHPSQQGLANFLAEEFNIPDGSPFSVRRDYIFYPDGFDFYES